MPETSGTLWVDSVCPPALLPWHAKGLGDRERLALLPGPESPYFSLQLANLSFLFPKGSGNPGLHQPHTGLPYQQADWELIMRSETPFIGSGFPRQTPLYYKEVCSLPLAVVYKVSHFSQ